jgi:hypothetical protein
VLITPPFFYFLNARGAGGQRPRSGRGANAERAKYLLGGGWAGIQKRSKFEGRKIEKQNKKSSKEDFLKPGEARRQIWAPLGG